MAISASDDGGAYRRSSDLICSANTRLNGFWTIQLAQGAALRERQVIAQPVAPPVCGGRGADPRRLPRSAGRSPAAAACWGSWLAWMRSTTRSTCGSSRAAPAASMATRSPCSRNASLASVEVRNRSERGHAVSIACRVAEAFWRVLNRRRAPAVVVINEAVEKILSRRVPMALSSYSLVVLGAPGGTTDSTPARRDSPVPEALPAGLGDQYVKSSCDCAEAGGAGSSISTPSRAAEIPWFQ